VFASLLIVLYRQGLSGWIFGIGFIATFLFVISLFMKQYSWTVFGAEVQGTMAFIAFLTGLAGFVLYLLRKQRGSRLVVGGSYLATLGYYLSVDWMFDHMLKPHHQNRINELLGIVSDPLGAGYNVHQSMIAIGSGGFSGKGFLQGTQTKFHFVPEQSTDFIFCTVGEEWGFIGSFVVITLFVFLLGRIIWNAEKQRSPFTRIYGYSVASILFIHFAINIAMTIGLAPVIGIPLPFFSYGGSSLWSFTLLLFTFIKLDSERKYVLR
jgi:rod shape determining protein RodA